MTPFAIVTEVKDPICGMSVNPADAKYKSDFDGRAFYFCCARCKQVFDKEPAAALGLTTTWCHASVVEAEKQKEKSGLISRPLPAPDG